MEHKRPPFADQLKWPITDAVNGGAVNDNPIRPFTLKVGRPYFYNVQRKTRFEKKLQRTTTYFTWTRNFRSRYGFKPPVAPASTPLGFRRMRLTAAS